MDPSEGTTDGPGSASTTRRTFLAATATGAVGGSLSLAGCLGGDDGGSVTWEANSPAAEGSVHGDAAEWLGDIVEEETDGEVTIEAFKNSELGGQIESIENVSTGGLDMYVIPYALVGTQYAPAQVYDTPYMYDDSRPYEHLMEETDPVNSEHAQTLVEDMVAETDIRAIGSVPQGTRRVTIAGDDFPTNPEELGEYLLRAVPIPIYEEAVVGLGAQTTEIDFSEVPSALATGSIDGQENPYNIITSSGIHEHTDYVLETNHMHVPLAIIVNEQAWQEDLTDDQRDIFYEAAREIRTDAIDLITDTIEADKQTILDEGAEIITPDQLDMEAFRSQTREHVRSEFPDFMDTVESIAPDGYQ